MSEATWTPTLFQEFEKRRGYKLEEHLPELIAAEVKTVADYRETLGDLLLENFTQQWTAWAHSHGATTRNQAHGSPANLIDLYAEVDIPECEGFGLSDFKIKGLRTDPGFTKPNYSDISMLKYASSGAHIAGKKYTSSETFTWLTEHFRTSLDVRGWRKPCVLPRFLLLSTGCRMARLAILRFGRYDSKQPSVEGFTCIQPVHPALSVVPAMGTARQRLPRVSAIL